MSNQALSDRLRALAGQPLFPAAGILAVSVGIILGAWAFQVLGGLAPCPLCLEQRVPWYVLILVGGGLVGLQSTSVPRALVTGLFAAAALLALWSAGQGLYHAGIEYQWWKGPPTCTTDGSGVDLDGGLSSITTSEIVMCDVAAWTLLGVSLAGFNFLFSLVVFGLAGLGLRASSRSVK